MPNNNNSNKGRVIAVGGFPGTGKSTLTRSFPELSPIQKDHLVSGDKMRTLLWLEQNKHFDPADELPSDAFNSNRLHNELAGHFLNTARHIVDSGKTAILDSGFTTPAMLRKLYNFFDQQSITGIWLSAPRDELIRRVSDREDPHYSTSDVSRLSRIFEREADRPDTWIEINTTELSPEETAKKVLTLTGITP